MSTDSRAVATTASSSSGSSANFSRDHYLVLRNLVTGPALAFLHEYALKTAEFGAARLDDSQAPGTPSQYGDPIMESLMEVLLPFLEMQTGRKLHSTYAYFRVYKHGDILIRHTDRPACEISVTLCLGYQADGSWPICLEQAGAAKSFALEPGDGLVYKGIETPHWRDRFTGERAAQVFMHYVDQEGQFKEWAFDKRAAMASNPVTRQIVDGFRPFLYQQGRD
jgi:hypothetical protein